GDAASVRLARRAALELSRAIGAGHVCLRLADLAATLAAEAAPPGHGLPVASMREALLASGVVGTPERPEARPLILDAEQRLYLQRHFDYERRLARRLLQAARAAPQDVGAATRERLQALFGAHPGIDWQKIAAALALRQRLVVISGGPGTGKTSTVVNLLACLIEQQPRLRIALAAPTGKAAARLGQAVLQRAGHLPAALRARLPTLSHTVHRLLGAHPGGFTHHAGNPLAIDVLVVDEASMLDLALATRLLEAVPGTARIILLGDKDQLAAVESGAVFAELSADPSLSATCIAALAACCEVLAENIAPAAPIERGALHDSVVWFTQNYRFGADSGIARAAGDIRLGRTGELIGWLRTGTDDTVRWLDEGDATPGPATRSRMAEGYAPYLDAVQHDPADVVGITRAFERFRVLCALREGPRGVKALNEQLSREARARLAPPGVGAHDSRSPWYAGRPVMVLRNDPLLRLFNGDIGITLPSAQGELMVCFADAALGTRAVPPLRLPAHETAFAMTVHKAQGSEFDEVLLLLPEQRSRVLTRELLYTALTRARQRVWLAGAAPVLAAAIDTPTRRHSGLLARLRDEAALLQAGAGTDADAGAGAGAGAAAEADADADAGAGAGAGAGAAL
ncbi:MAG TPA: exodeoxyribonuclease V subunit alpha, partial [Rubrivivax sp.]|nr:exodeoxyribonuclease V subunit alpha [Rubrivivax sp.]